MPSKKVIAGLLGIIIAVSVVALIPVFMYGFSVNVTEIEATLGLSSSGSPSTSSSITLQQAPDYNASSFSVEARSKALNAYEYFFSTLGGDDAEVTGEGTGGGAVVDIYITFNLTTPSGNSFSFEFSPLDVNADGEITITKVYGPGDLQGEVGTFSLTITISIAVYLPINPDTAIFEKELTPVSLDFEVPPAPA